MIALTVGATVGAIVSTLAILLLLAALYIRSRNRPPRVASSTAGLSADQISSSAISKMDTAGWRQDEAAVRWLDTALHVDDACDEGESTASAPSAGGLTALTRSSSLPNPSSCTSTTTSAAAGGSESDLQSDIDRIKSKLRALGCSDTGFAPPSMDTLLSQPSLPHPCLDGQCATPHHSRIQAVHHGWASVAQRHPRFAVPASGGACGGGGGVGRGGRMGLQTRMMPSPSARSHLFSNHPAVFHAEALVKAAEEDWRYVLNSMPAEQVERIIAKDVGSVAEEVGSVAEETLRSVTCESPARGAMAHGAAAQSET
mmetsp:Transcript_16621/g.33489  ORF Transcript_16621/g.33489 Transcript_16621/m.33489 type:complete len:314 (-) Transcript_16621:215-1156(-)